MRTPNRDTPKLPPWLNTADGVERRVGVEMEIGGMPLASITERVRASIGGVVRKESQYRAAVEETCIGRVGVEFDASLFSDFKLRGILDELPLQFFSAHDLPASLEKWLASAAAHFVPFELVFPPVPISHLAELEKVREALQREAEGTGSSVFNGFGLHLNPEIPDLKVRTALQYLRAFLCLYEDLVQSHRVDTTRVLSPFIDPFTKEYAALVLDEAYEPDWPKFTTDYLRHNPTRNRPLDLLPLMAEVNEATVRDALPEEKINNRPTLHYRLPDCRIDEPGWSITAEWNRWMAVEILVCDEEKLSAACHQMLTRSGFKP